MRLSALAFLVQVFLGVLILGIGVVGLVVLQDVGEELAGLTDQGLDPLAGKAYGAMGFVAVLCGLALFALIVLGAWINRHILRPFRSLALATRAVAEGHAHRRVTEFGALGDLAALARDINAIAEQIRSIRTIPEEQELLLRAAVERLLNKEGIPSGVVDRSGRIVVTNGALREILRETECTGRSLIGREEGCPIDVQVTEVQDAGVLRGYLVRAPAPTSTSGAS